MKKFLLYAFSLSVLILLSQSCNEALEPELAEDEFELKSASSVKKSYIVVLNDNELNTELEKLKGYEKKQTAVKAKSAKILTRAGITDGEIGHVYGTALKGFSVKIPPGQLKKLKADASVKYIEEDKIISLIVPFAKPDKPGKPGGGGDGGGSPDPQTTPWGITRVNGGVSGAAGKAWIIDSGIDLNHPDLNVNSTLSKNFTKAKSADDDNGHGSHVAGTIAAIDDDFGVIGVAPGAELVAVKVLDRRGNGSYSGVIAGIDYVGANGINSDVANMSLGGGKSQAINDAVITASTTVKFVLAAGNESTDAGTKSPASANGNNIYTISAMAQGDIWASYSNYGNPPVDFCAPGSGISSTWKDNGYKTISGTSMAAPHFAGLLLLGWTSNTDGEVSGDPDGNADLIAVH